MLSDPVAEAFGLIHRHPSGENLWYGMVKHLPEDERSFSRNVASLKNVIQGKANFRVSETPSELMLILSSQVKLQTFNLYIYCTDER